MKTSNQSTLKPIVEHLFINVIFDNNEFDDYLTNLEHEIKRIKKQYYFKIKSIYLANDKVLLDNQLTNLLKLITIFNSKTLVEYSFECTYNNLSDKKLQILKIFNVNRLVWKVITFQQATLTLINQKYYLEEIMNNIKTSIKLGFTNFSLDLQYNLPQQKSDNIIKDIEQCLLLNSPHISYESSDDQENLSFKKLINKLLTRAQYDNYEIFSYAKTSNYQAQQTLGYLYLNNWYGLGPNANSFIKTKAQILSIKNDNSKHWITNVSIINQAEYYQLYLMQGLMLKTGINFNESNGKIFNYYQSVIKKLINQQLLVFNNNNLKTTNHGWILLNKTLTVMINNNN